MVAVCTFPLDLSTPKLVSLLMRFMLSATIGELCWCLWRLRYERALRSGAVPLRLENSCQMAESPFLSNGRQRLWHGFLAEVFMVRQLC